MAKTPFQGFRLRETKVVNPVPVHVDRAFHRYSAGPWGEHVEIVFEGQVYHTTVVDQSLAGLGLKYHGTLSLKVGQIVLVKNRDGDCRAKIAFVKALPSGETMLGLMLIIEKAPQVKTPPAQ